MPTHLNFHFDPELFLLNWQNEVDPVQTALLESGAVVNDATIQQLIANGSNFYTIPFYNALAAGDPQNYDGETDILSEETSGGAQSGVVFGRMKSWTARDFIRDFNSADPMGSITRQVAKWWNKYRQNQIIKLMNGVFSVNDDSTAVWDNWQLHTTNLAATGNSVSAANKIGATSIGDTIQKAVGDNSGAFSIAVMHSKVANTLAGLDLLEFRKYTDAAGVARPLNIADANGLTVIVDDGVPVAGSSVSGEKEYTTYLFGTGAILRASAPVEHAMETHRDPNKHGGIEQLITRVRETIHPNGFTFVQPVGMAASPTDDVLFAASNWKLAVDPKSVAMARLITNG